MTAPVHNFNPGPAALPVPVLEQVRRDLLDFAGCGMSILEISHRSALYEQVHYQAIADLRTLLGCSADYSILFMGGGAQTQFAAVPMNLLPASAYAHYLVTGPWSLSALHEARKLGDARELWSSAASGFDRVPAPADIHLDPDTVYVHYTSNNTVVGTQYAFLPETRPVPLVSDMSSDLLSRPIDLSRFGLIYAGAQKNLGPAGVTIVIIRQDVLDRCRTGLPSTLSYTQMAATHSLLNTPPVFAIYVVGLVAQYLLNRGGLAVQAAQNAAKAKVLYDTIDDSGGFYRGCAHRSSRSQMNVTFRLPSTALEEQFVTLSTQQGFVGLQGHRAVGGIRASLYNAVPLHAVQALTAFMSDFQQRCA
jgi:phosphoserine aminotransferase